MPETDFQLRRRDMIKGLVLWGALGGVPVTTHVYLGLNGYKRGLVDVPRALNQSNFRELERQFDWDQTVKFVRRVVPLYLELPGYQVQLDEENVFRLAAIAADAYKTVGYVDKAVTLANLQMVGARDPRIPVHAIARACDALPHTLVDPYRTLIFRHGRFPTSSAGATSFAPLMALITHESGHIQGKCAQPFHDENYIESSIESATVFALAELAREDTLEGNPFLKTFYYVTAAHAINSMFVRNYREGFAKDTLLQELVDEYEGKDTVLDSLLYTIDPDERQSISQDTLIEWEKYFSVYSLMPHCHTMYTIDAGNSHKGLFVPTGRDLYGRTVQRFLDDTTHNRPLVLERLAETKISRRRLFFS